MYFYRLRSSISIPLFYCEVYVHFTAPTVYSVVNSKLSVYLRHFLDIMSELMVNKRRYATEEDDEIQKFLRLVEKDDEEYETYVPLKQRLQNSKDGNDRIKERAMSDESENEGDQANVKQKSLLDIAEELKQSQKNIDQKTLKQIKQRDSELLLLKEANQVQNNALQSNEEIAQGTRYTERLLTSWTAPSYIRSMSKQENDLIRKKWHIIVEGSDCPPPVKSFREMKFPSCVLEALEKKGITRPTPIQVQGCPALLTGRDLIGIAFTGSGKTLTFALPMIMMCLEEELNMPIEPTEGPLGLVLCPSRELARQTYEVVEHFCGIINSDRNLRVQLRSTLCIGGEDKRQQVEPIYRRGVHIVVATPGRLNDLLNQNKLNLDICKYLVLDEADRMLDLGFDEEVHNIINKFKRQRQTVLFSATMPQKFQDFARNTLVDPLVVNVGRAGAANLDVIQEVEYVKQEAKIVYLLECLQKTAPPVIIFCERKGDVDEIQEYLLLKGVSAVSIHGGKDQEERSEVKNHSSY